MSNNFLSFLSNVKVEDVAPKSAHPSNATKQRNPNPTFLGFRVWANGAIYPSQALADAFNLEYRNAVVSQRVAKDGTTKNIFTVSGDPGLGIDIIDTRKWGQIDTPKHFVAVAFSPKNQPKIDLFGLVRYTDDGVAASSVMEQGSSTFGSKTLLPLLKEVYGVEPSEEGFIDVEVMTPEAGGRNLRSQNGLELLPKVVSRGEDAGKPDYVRRENVDIFPILPVVKEELKEEATLPDSDPVEAIDQEILVQDDFLQEA